jgi:putative phosphoesterase
MNSLPRSTVRIGVFSDTHLPDSADAQAFLLHLLNNVLAPVDMILHAGDLVSPELLNIFDGYPMHAVRGNMDPAIRGVPLKKVIHVKDFTIGLIHGWGPPEGIEDRVCREFDDVALDCLVYGHSHRPACHHRDGLLLFNPGSATDRRDTEYHSVGLLELDETIRGTVIRLD